MFLITSTHNFSCSVVTVQLCSWLAVGYHNSINTARKSCNPEQAHYEECTVRGGDEKHTQGGSGPARD